MKHSVPLLLLLGLGLAACNKKDDPTAVPVNPAPANPVAPVIADSSGAVSMRFAARAGGQPLVLSSGSYTIGSGASVRISTFKYFISNLRLNGAAGTATYAEPGSYHLVSAADAGGVTGFRMTGVPKGTYSGVTFLVGVDSARNTSGAQTGDLDPSGRAAGMFWDWNTGYIMAKLEGSSPQSGDMNQSLTYHIGGFSGPNSGLRTVTLLFPQPVLVSTNSSSTAYVSADALKWFGAPNPIDVVSLYFSMSVSATSRGIADNYATMFTADSVAN